MISLQSKQICIDLLYNYELTTKQIQRFRTELAVKSYVSHKYIGKPAKNVEAYEILDDKQTFKDRIAKPGEVYYYYDGPLDEKTREFCRYILKLDKVFTISEIGYMSTQLGYNVYQYQGSYNCRHIWRKFRGKLLPGPAPTDRQIQTLIEKNINFK